MASCQQAKQGYRDALDALRAIPELLALTWGDDARHFEGHSASRP